MPNTAFKACTVSRSSSPQTEKMLVCVGVGVTVLRFVPGTDASSWGPFAVNPSGSPGDLTRLPALFSFGPGKVQLINLFNGAYSRTWLTLDEDNNT